MMPEPLAVGVDVGGTKIAFALVSAAGEALITHRVPTQPEDGPVAVLERIAAGIAHLLEQTDQPVAGVGLGCPGHIDPASGMARNVVNLGWREVPLRDGVRVRLTADLPVYLDNDANASALGEYYFGAARGCRDFVYLAVGTGLGGAAVVDGSVVHGANANAMEVGHMPLDSNGRLCGCGLRGCVERYVSGVGLLAGLEEHRPAFPYSPLAQLAEPSTAAILEAAQGGDPLARTILSEAGQWLGRAMAVCASLFNPALFVIGGGLGHAAADYLVRPAEQMLYARILPASAEQLRVVRSQITISAVGAACLVWQNHPTTKRI
ncbi:MAG: ROK family protein [Chloroflexi bacterium]|nr:ROK family protein [Chloroflexota bacterium]